MKKILLVCHDPNFSGANMSLIDWIGKNDNNFEFTILLPRHNKLFEDKIINSGCKFIIGYYTVPVKHVASSCSFITKIKDVIKYIYSITFNNLILYIISKKIKKESYDIIHSNSFSTIFGAQLSKLTGIKHVWHIREFMEEDHQITHYNQKKLKEYCKDSNAIFISDIVKKEYKNFKFKKSVVIYNTIKFNSLYKKERGMFQNNECNILIAGALTENKGQLEAIKAVDLVNKKGKKTNLYICGCGPYEKELKKYVKNNKICNINFLGYKSNLLDIRKEMDISLMCSKKEALGRVTIEGMYYENLVIGSDTGCTPLIIKNKNNGLLYKNGDINDLANKIIYAIDNKKESIVLMKSAKEYAVNNFSKSIYDKITNFYKRI